MKPDQMLAPLPAGKLPGWLLRKVLPGASSDSDVLVGPGLGRDAAAIQIGDRVVVAKNDPITFASEHGYEHLVEVNANDIACMGGVPRWLLVTALLPMGVTPADVLNQFAELREAARRRGVALVGGHSEVMRGLERPILVGMMLGEATPETMLAPGQAQAGDALLLTKALAIEGTALLARERHDVLSDLVGVALVADAARLMENPGISVVRDAELADSTGGVSALHDPTEGGLLMAARELAAASHLGLEIDADAVPVLPETRAIADALGLDPLGMLASGALLIAAAPEAVSNITSAVASAEISVRVIGHLTPEPDEAVLLVDGERRQMPMFAVDEVARELSRPDA